MQTVDAQWSVVAAVVAVVVALYVFVQAVL